MISAHESGLRQPDIRTLKEMSKRFKVSTDYIVGNSDIKLSAEIFSKENLSSIEIQLLDLFKSLNNAQQQAI